MKFLRLRALTGALCLLLSLPLHAEDELVSLDDEPVAQTAPAAAPTKTPQAAAPAAGATGGENLEALEDLDAAPAAGGDAGGESLESLDGSAATASGEEEVALDLGTVGGGEDFFNPYVFSRDRIWALLPIFGLIILGLHLLPVPKRQSKRKIDQAQRFFRGLSGESTGMINLKELRESTRTSIQRPKKGTE